MSPGSHASWAQQEANTAIPNSPALMLHSILAVSALAPIHRGMLRLHGHTCRRTLERQYLGSLVPAFQAPMERLQTCSPNPKLTKCGALYSVKLAQTSSSRAVNRASGQNVKLPRVWQQAPFLVTRELDVLLAMCAKRIPKTKA